MPKPPRNDNAWIDRALRSDSEALRYAEWWVRRRIYGLSDDEARWLYRVYKGAYTSMASTLSTAYDNDNKPLIGQRLRVLNQIEAEMNALSTQVGAHLLETSTDAYAQGYYGRAWELDQATLESTAVKVTLLPREAIRAMVQQPLLGRNKKYAGVDWATELGLAREEFVWRVKRSLTTSMINGEGIQAAQRRLRDELGIRTDRRSGFKRNFYQTLMIARTEILRASNLGAQSIYEQNQDVLRGWEWVATRDERTCFPAWVKVETEGGPRPIASLKPGELVLTRSGYKRVLNVMRKQYAGRLVRVEAGGRQVVATADHLFWANGWKEAGTLTTLDTLQTFENKPVKVQGVFNVMLSDANNAPPALGKQSIAARVFGGVLMPVIAVHLKRNRAFSQGEVNRFPADLKLLSVYDAETVEALAHSGLKHRFTLKGAIARKAAKLARRFARTDTEILPAVATVRVVRRAAAFLRAVFDVGTTGGELFATAGTRLVKRVSGATGKATDVVAVSNIRFNAEFLTAYRTSFGNVVGRTGCLIARAGTEASTWLACQPFKFLTAVLASDNCIAGAFGPLPSVITGTRAVFSLGPLTNEVDATVGTNLVVSHIPIISRVATHSKKPVWVYDIEVEDAHEFYAEGLLVHNCPICGGLDGKVFDFDSTQLIPPSGSHPGCRCTSVPVLIDQEMQDRVAGVRETYRAWSERVGVGHYAGGLDTQTTADAHGNNSTSGQG